MQYQIGILSLLAVVGLAQASALMARANGKANEFPTGNWLVNPVLIIALPYISVSSSTDTNSMTAQIHMVVPSHHGNTNHYADV
jgi:hypothetical protein